MLVRTIETFKPGHPFAGLERGYYRAISADPPWSYECFSEKGKGRSADQHYVTMRSPEIEQFPVGELAARDAHLFLWITGPCLAKGMHLPVMQAWGFTPSALAFVWIKPKRGPFANGRPFLDETLFAMGMGHTTRANAEYVVLGRRGSPRRLRKDVRQLIVEPKRELRESLTSSTTASWPIAKDRSSICSRVHDVQVGIAGATRSTSSLAGARHDLADHRHHQRRGGWQKAGRA